ncbi:target of Myb1 membrane trafficking protein-like, partial [Lampetra planeri]
MTSRAANMYGRDLKTPRCVTAHAQSQEVAHFSSDALKAESEEETVSSGFILLLLGERWDPVGMFSFGEITDFLAGNAFSTPVGQRIERATSGALQSEDWGLNMEICDIINETDEGPRDAVRALKKRIVGNKNFRELMLSLTVLEACVKNCGHRFHVLVTSQDFVEGVLVRSILPKYNPPTALQDRVLSLIQSWADAFRSAPSLAGVVYVYDDLRRRGLEFPMTDLDALSPIHTPNR